MDNQDQDAIIKHIGKINGKYAVYFGTMPLTKYNTSWPHNKYLLTEIKITDTFETIRECKLTIECNRYKQLYAKVLHDIICANNSI